MPTTKVTTGLIADGAIDPNKVAAGGVVQADFINQLSGFALCRSFAALTDV